MTSSPHPLRVAIVGFGPREQKLLWDIAVILGHFPEIYPTIDKETVRSIVKASASAVILNPIDIIKHSFIEIDLIRGLAEKRPLLILTEYFEDFAEFVLPELGDSLTIVFDSSRVYSSRVIGLRLTELMLKWNAGNMAGASIEFREDTWGQLVPIEYALGRTLENRFAVQKHPGKLVIQLKDSNDFQALLDALFPVVAAVERYASGQISTVTLQQNSIEKVTISGSETERLLKYLCERFDEQFPKLTFGEKTLIESVGEFPGGGALKPALEEWFGAKHPLKPVSRAIFTAYSKFSEGLREVISEQPPQWPLM